MRSGQLRHKIRIEVPVQVKQPNGSVKITWSLYREVFANIETLKGFERQVATASWPASDVKIGMRYVAGLLPTMRVVYNGKSYSILGINDIEERHRELEITTQQGVSAI
jgi:SPP1 family predicted phage head-tail adaptor